MEGPPELSFQRLLLDKERIWRQVRITREAAVQAMKRSEEARDDAILAMRRAEDRLKALQERLNRPS
jgi:hypothetical protein